MEGENIFEAAIYFITEASIDTGRILVITDNRQLRIFMNDSASSNWWERFQAKKLANLIVGLDVGFCSQADDQEPDC